jgi:hypothetical protein
MAAPPETALAEVPLTLFPLTILHKAFLREFFAPNVRFLLIFGKHYQSVEI